MILGLEAAAEPSRLKVARRAAVPNSRVICALSGWPGWPYPRPEWALPSPSDRLTEPAPPSGSPQSDRFKPVFAYGHAAGGVSAHQVPVPEDAGWAHGHSQSASALSANDLDYGSGINGIGVTTGHEKVYLDLWGSGWSTPGTDSSGDVTWPMTSTGGPVRSGVPQGAGHGTFAVQTIWANDGSGGSGACEGSDPTVTNPGG